ncbi:MAG: translocation/assembly module TamB domain-containing protein [Arcobacteraceae bacterium]|nr:translocation/assembly module TamB domain-containing protein [Arcobacteraceae bacterium]
MKKLKIFLITLSTLVFISFMIVTHSKDIANKIFTYIANQNLISYSSISGTISSGITITNINYDNKLKIENLYIRPSLLSLLALEIYIYDLRLNGIEFDDSLFESSDTNVNIPMTLYIKSLTANLKNHQYEQYTVNNLQLFANELRYNFKDSFSAKLNLDISSNIGEIKGDIKLNNTDYVANGEIKPNLDFINSLSQTKFNTISPININLKGNLNQFDFKANGNDVKLNYEKTDIDLNTIKTQGIYNIDSQFLNIKQLDTNLKIDTFTSHIKGNLQIQNHDLDTVIFDLDTNSELDKKLFVYLENNLAFHTLLKGNLYNMEFETSLDKNKISIDTHQTLLNNGKLVGKISIDKEFSNINIESSNNMDFNLKGIDFNLKTQKTLTQYDITKDLVKTQSDFVLSSKLGEALSDISLLVDINNSTNTVISLKSDIQKLNISDINLSQIYPLNLSLEYKNSQLHTNLKSKVFDMGVSTNDLEKFVFDINSYNLNPNEFYTLPSFSKINSISSKLKGSYDGQFDIKGDVTLNQSFIMKTSLSGTLEDLKATVKHKTFNSNLHKTTSNTLIDANINSLEKFQAGLNTIIIFDLVDIDGSVDLNTKIQKDSIEFELTSPKLNYDDVFIENVSAKGDFKNQTLNLQKVNFTLNDLLYLNLQKTFSLKEKAFINLETMESYANFDDVVFTSYKKNNKLFLHIDTKELFVAHGKYGSGFMTSKLLLNYDNSTFLVSGDISLSNLTTIYEPPAMSINKDKDIIIISKNTQIKKDDFFLDKFALDLTINANNFHYIVKDTNLRGSAILYLNKELTKDIKLYGSLSNVSGSFSELGKDYIIQPSNIYFRGLTPIDPILDIHALHKLQDVDITINIAGTLNVPRINLISNPTMSQRDILSYLIFGTRFSGDSRNTTEQSRGSQASLFLLNELSKDYAKELGVDMLYFEYNPTTQYIETHVGKNISQKSKVILKNQAQSGKLIFLRELTKLWNIEVGFEDNTQSVDLTYRKRY